MPVYSYCLYLSIIHIYRNSGRGFVKNSKTAPVWLLLLPLQLVHGVAHVDGHGVLGARLVPAPEELQQQGMVPPGDLCQGLLVLPGGDGRGHRLVDDGQQPHLLQLQACQPGQTPDGDRGRRAAQEHDLGRRRQSRYRVQLIQTIKGAPPAGGAPLIVDISIYLLL